MRRSVNGGASFSDDITVNSGNPRVVYQLPLKYWWIKGQGFPVVAADTSGGEFDNHDSTLYVVWAGLKYGPVETPDTAAAAPDYDPDIFFTKSTSAGERWLTTPIRVNDDVIGNGRDQWMPAMEVDIYGGINIVFFDSRNDGADQYTEVYLARSVDGGQTFVNDTISNVKFKPCNANGECSGPAGLVCANGATGFIGDYISVASDSSTLYACWSDNRFRRMGADSSVFQYYQTVVAPIPILDTVKGILTSSRTINGPCILEGDVTVNPSCTLSVKRGSWLIARADSDQTPSSYGIDANRTEIIVRSGAVLNIESTGQGRPIFTSTNKLRGSWYGVRVLNGGRIKGGIGARIEYAQVGLTIDTVTTADTLRGLNIRTCQIAGVITRSDAVAFENDTISDVPNGYGIQIDHADPSITGSQISNCQYGIYAVASKSRVRDSRIVGPGYYGIYNTQDVELPTDNDTLYVTKVSDSGYFTGAHMWAGYKAHAIIDSCRFATDTTPGIRSSYGVKAGESVYVKLRRSLIRDLGSAGFHSFKSKANLGTTKGASGNNSIHAVPVWLYDEELGWWSINPKRVYHTGNTSTDTLRAEDNWWGSSTPPSNWFTSLVDYNPYLTTDPGLGKIAPGALVSENQALPREFTLGQNYPNPFNGTTVIEYEIHAAGKVRLAVYNVLGQLVRSLIDETQSAGRHRAEWNGRDEHGRELASGVYFYQMQSDRQVHSKKMVLLK